MTTFDGFWFVVGWGFAVMSGLHLWRIASLQMKGMRMMREDPKGFPRVKQQYDEAMPRVEDER